MGGSLFLFFLCTYDYWWGLGARGLLLFSTHGHEVMGGLFLFRQSKHSRVSGDSSIIIFFLLGGFLAKPRWPKKFCGQKHLKGLHFVYRISAGWAAGKMVFCFLGFAAVDMSNWIGPWGTFSHLIKLACSSWQADV